MSLTFRKVRSSLKCNCSYRASCDSGILDSTSSSLSEEKANDLEQNNVFLVYDTIAGKRKINIQRKVEGFYFEFTYSAFQ